MERSDINDEAEFHTPKGYQMTFANKVTLFRIVSIPFFIAALAFYTPERAFLKGIALGIFLLAIVSDVIDGYIARSHRQKTPAGAILDPVADKALLIAAFLLLYHVSKSYLAVALPLWVVVLVVSRDVIILIGGALILMVNKSKQITPTWWGKATTFFQMATVAGIILEVPAVRFVWWLACLLTAISGVDYARRGIHALNNTQLPEKTC